MQPSDVPVTYTDSKALDDDYGFRPTIGLREGLRKFAEWYKEYTRTVKYIRANTLLQQSEKAKNKLKL